MNVIRETGTTILSYIKKTFEMLRNESDQYHLLEIPDDEAIIKQIDTVLPYYAEEMRGTVFFNELSNSKNYSKGALTGQCAYVFPIIKTMMHLRLFKLNNEKCLGIYRRNGKVSAKLEWANEQACFDVMWFAYSIGTQLKKDMNSALLYREHLYNISDAFMTTLARSRKVLSNISIDYIDAVFGQISLLHKSITAQLTEMLLNRSGLLPILSSLSKSHSEIGVMMFDIDNFKQVNDDCGHVHGDNILLQIGSRIEEIRKKYNGVAARIGGEEFFMAIPDVKKADIKRIAGELNKSLKKIKRENPKTRTTFEKGGDFVTYMSASIGVGIWNTAKISFKGDMTLTELMKMLDKAMYESKESGRNCSTFTDL